MKILVTGGAGYIASHTNVELINAKYDVVALDNFSNSNYKAIANIEKITGAKVKFYEGDVRDVQLLEKIFTENKIDAVMHFAGLKAVGESVQKPLMYYHNNLVSTLNLLEVMRKFGVKKFIFSSSATVYGVPKKLPLDEECDLSTTNPYGSTKLMIENILRDLQTSDNAWNIVLLRYFNPVGAHSSGLIGEDPQGIPNNLMPYIAKVAVGELPYLNIFGNDYATNDGTGVRDYIHVVDLAKGHVAALKNIEKFKIEAINLGTGEGYSVLEMVKAFQNVSGKEIPYVIKPRRPGDIDASYASPSKAKAVLGWEAELTLEDMCKDLWNFQKRRD